MSTFSEMISVCSSLDLKTLLGTAAAVLPLAAAVFASAHEHDENCGCERPDVEKINGEIARLEGVRNRTIEQQEELSEQYVALAIALYDNGNDLNEILAAFGKSEAILQQTLAQGEDSEIRRKLGTVYLHMAVTYNDFDELEEAIGFYDKAIQALTPLDNQGDGEAKYDIAGIKLNRGAIFHELGDFDKANKDFDEAFTAFRAVEKISDLDTRFYMAKTSVSQGALYRDMGEPLDKITDAYNRAMRLLVELIDLGQMEHEQELANTLMDRCTASYEAYMNQDFESEADRTGKFDDVILNVGRAIDILRKAVAGNEGNHAARTDLFNALCTQGAMYIDIDKYKESLPIFDDVIGNFADFAQETDPVVVNQYGAALENRGFAKMNLDELSDALADFNKAIECRQRIQSDSFELDDEERLIFLPALATSFANRANAQAALGKTDLAKADCQRGLDLLKPLAQDGDDEISEIEQMFNTLLKQWS